MSQIFAGQNNKISLLFLIAIIIYIISSYHKVDSANILFESRESNKDFIIKLSKEFKEKAGVIISKNNFDPIMPNTILRVFLRTNQNYIKGYTYKDKKLTISTYENSNIIDIRDIIKYLAINKNKNNYTLYLK
jgi:hypothetical protein